MTQQEFTDKYYHKVVRPLGKFYKLPQKEYLVTAALLNFDDEGQTTIFAIQALDYDSNNKHWFTLQIDIKQLDERMADFEILN